MNKLTYFIACLVFMPVSALLNGWAVVKLWGWFIASYGLATPGYWHAAGIALLIRYLTIDMSVTMWEKRSDSRPEHERYIEQVAMSVTFPLFAVGIGWVYHSLS